MRRRIGPAPTDDLWKTFEDEAKGPERRAREHAARQAELSGERARIRKDALDEASKGLRRAAEALGVRLVEKTRSNGSIQSIDLQKDTALFRVDGDQLDGITVAMSGVGTLEHPPNVATYKIAFQRDSTALELDGTSPDWWSSDGKSDRFHFGRFLVVALLHWRRANGLTGP